MLTGHGIGTVLPGTVKEKVLVCSMPHGNKEEEVARKISAQFKVNRKDNL